MSHSHSHSHSLSGPAPVDPLPARIVVGLLVAIGLAVLAGAVVLWPSREHVDIPMPLQNAAGGAVSTQAGHVLSSGMGDCGSPSVSQVLTTAPQPAPPGAGRCVLTQVAIDSGPNAGASTLLESSPAPASRSSRWETTFGSSARSTTRAPPATRSTTSNGAGRWSPWPSRSRWWSSRWRAGGAAGAGRHRGRVLGAGGVLLPALRRGPAIPVALVASAAILYAVIYLAHGVSLRTSAALLGTLTSLLLARDCPGPQYEWPI